jgi:magnesium chelatase family protein
VGGGTPLPKPGAASLAHRGVLFLDEAPEFAGGTLDALRQPLESGELVIARSAGTARFPARFTLVLAANPCPCAATNGAQACSCPSSVRRRYLTRLSGPLLDRIDVRVDVLPVSRAALADPPPQETTATVAARVANARARAAARLAGTPWRINADVPGTELRRRWPLPTSVTVPADLAFTRGRLTLRGYDRVLRIAWTLADLRDLGQPGADEVAEAVGLRLPEELDGPTRAPGPAPLPRREAATGRADIRPVREEAS